MYQQTYLWIISMQSKTFILLHLTILLHISFLIIMEDNVASIGLHISLSAFFDFCHWFVMYYNSRLLTSNTRSANAIKVFVKRGKDWCHCRYLVVRIFEIVKLVRVSELVITCKWVVIIIWFRLLKVNVYFYRVIDIIKATYSYKELWRFDNPSITAMFKFSILNSYLFNLTD